MTRRRPWYEDFETLLDDLESAYDAEIVEKIRRLCIAHTEFYFIPDYSIDAPEKKPNKPHPYGMRSKGRASAGLLGFFSFAIGTTDR